MNSGLPSLTPGEFCPIPDNYGGFSWYWDMIWVAEKYSPSGAIENVIVTSASALGIEINSPTNFDFNGSYLLANESSVVQVTVEGKGSSGVVYKQDITVYDGDMQWFDFNFMDVSVISFTPQSHNLAIDDFTFNESGNPVPEPASIGLLSLGIVGAFIRRKRRV